MVKKLMRHLGNKISRGRRGARESLYPPIFHRSDPRALEIGSRCPCLGDFAPRGSDSRNSQGSGGESFLRKESFSTRALSLPIESGSPSPDTRCAGEVPDQANRRGSPALVSNSSKRLNRANGLGAISSSPCKSLNIGGFEFFDPPGSWHATSMAMVTP